MGESRREKGKMERERKCVFSIKRLSWRLGGIHWLFDVLFDDAFSVL